MSKLRKSRVCVAIYLSIFSTLAWGQGELTVFSNWDEIEEKYQTLEDFSNEDLNEGCNLRAHHWSYSLDRDYKIQSGKIFIMFTPLMQSDVDVTWWYHVAPYVLLENSHGRRVEVVLDRAHFNRPVELEEWVRRFAPNGCRKGQTLADYNDNLILGGCVTLQSSMFHFGPGDLQSDARAKAVWDCQDMYKVAEAFGGRGGDLQPPHCKYLGIGGSTN